MICVSVGEKDFREAVRAASAFEFAEIRLDLLGRVDSNIAKKIFSSHKKLIATYRKGNESDRERLEILETAVESGAAFVDSDISENLSFISSVRTFCRDKAVFIVSYHDFKETPSFSFLDAIITRAFSLGADAVKIACSADNITHVERLLSLPDYYGRNKIIIAGMGNFGERVRILSESAGSWFTYASLPGKSATASGQLDHDELLMEQGRLSSVW
ncbi:MAG: type I 3-dehydroquinate dehydratase [Spirochaetia bacterium]|jgi:3-dehydroquinate dehydratase type I|nr:type I 3-dehydroquinate dehydratase [Spirochaetia bacterium]